MLVLIASVLLLVIHHGEGAMTATSVLYGQNSMTTFGTLTFAQDNTNAAVHITGTLSGLNASSAHGFHVHVSPVSEGSPNCTAAGPHFNPYNKNHGPRTTDINNRHVGDLGNITTNANGVVNIDISDNIIQLYNATQSIVNRTIIVHLDSDDGGQGGSIFSNTTGNAGARMFCGLIKLSTNEFNHIKPTISILLMTMFISLMILF